MPGGDMDECPNCFSNDSYSYNIHGIYLNYVGLFGEGRQSEECTDIGYYTNHKRPVFAKCDNCGKQIRLSKLKVKTP